MTASPSPRDPLAVLDAVRPADLDQLWPTDRRQDALARILATDPSAADAGGLPDVGSRLTAVRTTRTRLRVAVAATLTTVAAAAAVLGLLPGSAIPQASAFAGYRLTPTPLSPAAQAEQAQGCRDALLAQSTSFAPEQLAEIGSAPLVAADARGGWEFTVLLTPDAELGAIGVYCLANPQVSVVEDDPGWMDAGTTEGPRPDLLAPVAAGDLHMGYGFGYHLTNGEGAFGEFGRVGSDVTAVTLILSDGTQVDATVSDGWYAAWWPVGPSTGIAADDHVVSYQIATPTGTSTSTP